MTFVPLGNPLSNTLFELQAAEPFYFRQDWLNLITKLYGYSLLPLTVTNSTGRITGFLPLCYIQSCITGSRLVSLPFSDYCPLLAEDDSSANELLDHAVRLAQQYGVRYLELRTGVNNALKKRTDFVEGNLYACWATPLDAGPADLWSRLPKSVRGKIKKSRRLGVQILFAQCRKDMLEYCRLHLRTRAKKHGMPAQPQRFFLELWDTFAGAGDLRLLLAKHEGITIAGTILMTSGTTARFLYGASDERYLHLAPNNLLTWEAIIWCCRNGFHALAHGRTARVNRGLMQFNRNWAAIEKPLPYYDYPGMAGLATTSEISLKYHLLTSCWKRLPLQVAKPLGGYPYTHLG
jgi:Acetyltransferase (GNAT) domain